MSMDAAYKLHLLGLAVEECWRRKAHLEVVPPTCAVEALHPYWYVGTRANDGTYLNRTAETLADALAALLTDFGVTVPERPSAGRVAEMFPTRRGLSPGQRNYFVDELRDLYAREPLTVLALLEGGAS